MSLIEFMDFLKLLLQKVQYEKRWGSLTIEFHDGKIVRLRENMDKKIQMKD